VRRLPICRNLLVDAPAATRQPTPSHIWHLINIHRAAIALPASHQCSTHQPSVACQVGSWPWHQCCQFGHKDCASRSNGGRPPRSNTTCVVPSRYAVFRRKAAPMQRESLRSYQADRCHIHPLPRLRIVCNVSTLRTACGPTAIRYMIEWPKQLLHRIALFIVQR